MRVAPEPELAWNETDFLACLEVEPTIDDYESGYHYAVVNDGLRLGLSAFQYSSDIYITIYRDGVERPVIDSAISSCSGTSYINDSSGEFLEFAPPPGFRQPF